MEILYKSNLLGDTRRDKKDIKGFEYGGFEP